MRPCAVMPLAQLPLDLPLGPCKSYRQFTACPNEGSDKACHDRSNRPGGVDRQIQWWRVCCVPRCPGHTARGWVDDNGRAFAMCGTNCFRTQGGFQPQAGQPSGSAARHCAGGCRPTPPAFPRTEGKPQGQGRCGASLARCVPQRLRVFRAWPSNARKRARSRRKAQQ